MDSEKLRKACEKAGMQITDQPGGKWHAVTPFAAGQIGADVFVYKQDDPALKSYVAELLTAKVRERGAPVFGQFIKALLELCHAPPQEPEVGFVYTDLEAFFWFSELPDDVIRAAMAVLKGGGG